MPISNGAVVLAAGVGGVVAAAVSYYMGGEQVDDEAIPIAHGDDESQLSVAATSAGIPASPSAANLLLAAQEAVGDLQKRLAATEKKLALSEMKQEQERKGRTLVGCTYRGAGTAQ